MHELEVAMAVRDAALFTVVHAGVVAVHARSIGLRELPVAFSTWLHTECSRDVRARHGRDNGGATARKSSSVCIRNRSWRRLSRENRAHTPVSR